MAILNVQTSQSGETGVLPSYASILTNDTEATILTAGYLNQVVQNGASFALPCIAKISTKASSTADYQVGWYQITHVGSNWSAVPAGSPGDVVLPTVANQLVHATDATGTLSTDAANVVNLGNITAGSSAVAGSLTSFAGTGSTEFLRLAAINNTGGNFSTTLSNTASVGQSQIISIPDAAAATANFIISASSGTQNITTGALQVNAGAVSSGISTGGFVGLVKAFSTTATSGFIAIQGAINASGNFGSTISNAVAQAQAQVVTIPDFGAATGTFIMSSLVGAGIQHITTGSLEVDAGNLIAGLSTGGTAGGLILYPSVTTNGSLRLSPVANVGNFAATISNVTALGQATVYTMTDHGAATANFILSANASIQNITAGALQVNAGAITSGLSAGGFVGLLKAFSTTATSGFMAIQGAANASGDFGTTIVNSTAQAQATVLTIPDVGAATGFINGQSVTANLTPAGVIIRKDITLGFAALAAAGKVEIQAALATAQFKIRDIFVNYSAAGLSGGGGDRLVVLTDGTTVYNNAGITAALLGTPVNTALGGDRKSTRLNS